MVYLSMIFLVFSGPNTPILIIEVSFCIISSDNTLQMNKRTYLNVPYKDKGEAKRIGCKWDPKKKKWYCTGNGGYATQSIKRWGPFLPEPSILGT